MPWPNAGNMEVIRNVRYGTKMKQPPGCPDDVYAVMCQCWHPEANKRPAAELVYESLCNARCPDATAVGKTDLDGHAFVEAYNLNPLHKGYSELPVLRLSTNARAESTTKPHSITTPSYLEILAKDQEEDGEESRL